MLRLLGFLRRAYLRGRFGYTQGVDPRWSGAFAGLAAAVFGLLPGGRDVVEDSACRLSAPQPGARLLEVGFGNALQLERMRSLGWSVEGVDADPVAIEAARGRGLCVHQGDLKAQHFPDEAFDAVYLSHLIEHVHDPFDLLRECGRILRPNGSLVVITPNLRSLGHRRFGDAWVNLDPPRHLVLFSPRSLRSMVEGANLSVTRLTTSARIAFLIWVGSQEIRRFGHVISLTHRPAVSAVAIGILMQFLQAVALGFNPNVGEELVLVARKRVGA